MKKLGLFLTLIIITVIILIATPAFAERLKYTGLARSEGGAVLASATVAVYLAGTTTPADVYEASSGGTSVNEVTTDSNGRWTFYADTTDYAFTQEYKVVVTKDGYSSITLDNIFILRLPTNAAGALTNDGSGNYSWGDLGFDESANYSPTGDWTVTGTWDLSGATVTWPATITTTSFVGALTGNADTATALAANPDPCAAGSYVSDIAADGELTCANPLDTPTFILADDSTMTLPASEPTGLLRADAGVMSTTDSISGVTINGGTASTVAVWDGSQNLTSLSSQNVITTGYVDGAVKVTVSSSSPVTVSGSSGFYINGSDSAKTFTLPAASAGLAYCFANVIYANALTLDPAADDYIVLAGENNDADNVVSTGAATDKICVLAIDATYWLVTASTGTWAND